MPAAFTNQYMAGAAFTVGSLLTSRGLRCAHAAWRPSLFTLRNTRLPQPRGARQSLSQRIGIGGNGSGSDIGRHSGSSQSPSTPEMYAASSELDALLLRPSDAPVLAHIVTYNVLSSSLASASHYPQCDPSDLDANTRFARLLAKLEQPIASRAVICLQEVSLAWTGPLHSFFASRQFHFVVANYGSYFNGYMGVGLAFPVNVYDALDIRVERLTDSHRWPRQPQLTGAAKFISDIRARLCVAWEALFGDIGKSKASRHKNGRESNSADVWSKSRDRRNMIIFARLRSKTNGARLCVGTYHMPCAFYSPPQMMIHSALVVRRFQDLCAGDSGVLAGDFNIKPQDSSYKMITTGQINAADRDYPTIVPDNSSPSQWMPTPLFPMKSAYKAVLGQEPDFTNYALVEDNPPFIDTLDYLFCSPDLDVVDVIRLPHRNAVVQAPYPTRTEPSDHSLIGATLRLPAASSKSRRQSRENKQHAK